MKGMKEILVLGGVVAAGYLLLQSGEGSGGGTVQYIRNIPRAISPEIKEAPPTPTIIQLPSETVNFPAPKLPSVTSLLPQIPSTQPVKKTQPVTSTPKKVVKTTTETFTYGETKSGEMATTTELKKQKEKLEGTPLAEYFERVGHGGKVTVSSSKKTSLPKDWEKGSPYWEQAMKEPEKFSERSVWEVAKKIETQKKSTSTSTTKKTTEKKPPSLPGVTWVKKGSGWTATRSRASFVSSFGW